MTTLQPEQLIGLIDTREQQPFDLAPMRTERATLATGDYSVKGLEQIVAIERKSLPDLLACCGQQRKRFERELHRLLAYPVRAVVVEGSWDDIDAGKWCNRLTPSQVNGSVIGWIAQGIPFVLAGTRERAARFTAHILYLAARRRLQESERFRETLLAEGKQSA